MVSIINPEERLIQELFSKSPEHERCPFIRKDETSPYCAKNLQGNSEISEQRRMICDTFSLQLYCLNGPERHAICIFYQGKPID
jgi:Fe-S-cluster containining protein